MTTLTPNQLGVLIYANGRWGPHSNKAAAIKFLDEAIAVAYSESGWNTDAHNASGASGLYQILLPLHADKLPGANANIFDPAVNVEVARKVWNEAGRSWAPWKSSDNSKRQQGRGHGKAVWEYLHSLTPLQIAKIKGEISTASQSGRTAAGVADTQGTLADIQAQQESKQGLIDRIVTGVATWLANAGVAIGVFLLGLILVILGVAFFVKKRL